MFFLKICVCTACVPNGHGGQKRVLDPLTLQLQTAMSHHEAPKNPKVGPLQKQLELFKTKPSFQPQITLL